MTELFRCSVHYWGQWYMRLHHQQGIRGNWVKLCKVWQKCRWLPQTPATAEYHQVILQSQTGLPSVPVPATLGSTGWIENELDLQGLPSGKSSWVYGIKSGTQLISPSLDISASVGIIFKVKARRFFHHEGVRLCEERHYDQSCKRWYGA